ncbi:endonuclease/exonuclease/phosphatase family protein [Lignipirellula cremea]|uniref:Endonuclease/Exonuclease/phosphatase family protein n=1 Tax=Lignipirellula cremea TaxID=2528010 RepID=A0A518DYS0_9BACT|nr:endonuclease/exonuclease/phosphatase family protein [Lignipirellula cremea]QDU96986.1 Endonuclease/Exonuclease/phosphatase family protein [Lignipirellula cremea]
MAASKRLSFATCNLFNTNEPGLAMYRDTTGWTPEQYEKKIDWLGRALAMVDADVWGFQELWHHKSLANLFKKAKLTSKYKLLAPPSHQGGKIICAGAVRKEMLVGEPEWIVNFPDQFVLFGSGDDPQTPEISVSLKSFSRPVLHFKIRPLDDSPEISVFVAHLKSKMPARVDTEQWFKSDKPFYGRHREGLGAALSTIRRTAEAAALRMLLTEAMKGNDNPVVVLGDLNDDKRSNTLNIISGQPNYLMGFSTGGSDVDLYSAGTLQEYRSERDVYYTHVHQNSRESLDHILVSQEFYDNSRKRLWAFEGTEIMNDHLNRDDHKETGSTDHGIVKATFKFSPAKG